MSQNFYDRSTDRGRWCTEEILKTFPFQAHQPSCFKISDHQGDDPGLYFLDNFRNGQDFISDKELSILAHSILLVVLRISLLDLPRTCRCCWSHTWTANLLPWRNCVIFWPSPRPKNAIPRWYTGGSDTFQWLVMERDRVGGLRLMIWDKVKVPLCHYRDAPEESNLWTAWQLFPLDDD